jgi:hypothetical protein
MATIVNTPAQAADTDSGMGFLLGVVVLVALFFLFMLYGLPAMRQSMPSNEVIAPQIQVPDKIDVNVQPNK